MSTRLPFQPVCDECGEEDEPWRGNRYPTETQARIARDVHNRDTQHVSTGARVGEVNDGE